jgi:signal transduction histidine kinase
MQQAIVSDFLNLRLVYERESREHLMDKIEKLERELQNRDDLIAIVSHEVRSPLGTVLFQVEKLATFSADPGAKALADKIKNNITKISTLLNDLLCAISATKVALHVEEMDLVVAVREAVEQLSPEAEKGGCAIVMECPAELRGRWDPVRVNQVITNLLTNAIKYGKGKPIHVKVDAYGVDAIITVADQGVGIPPEERDRIFGKFERVSSGGGKEGFGLGLWVVKEIVDAFHGSISVEDHPDGGTVFRVLLPSVFETE